MYRKILLRQLIEDMGRLHRLIVRVATGEHHLTSDRDRLQAAVDIKVALLFYGPGTDRQTVKK